MKWHDVCQFATVCFIMRRSCTVDRENNNFSTWSECNEAGWQPISRRNVKNQYDVFGQCKMCKTLDASAFSLDFDSFHSTDIK